MGTTGKEKNKPLSIQQYGCSSKPPRRAKEVRLEYILHDESITDNSRKCRLAYRQEAAQWLLGAGWGDEVFSIWTVAMIS